MATIEVNGILNVKDKNGNLNMIYPVTKTENIADLEPATSSKNGLMPAEDKTKIDKISFIFGVDDTGPYIEEL